jgi:molybdopterin biosynthesis enzyme MoaB
MRASTNEQRVISGATIIGESKYSLVDASLTRSFPVVVQRTTIHSLPGRKEVQTTLIGSIMQAKRSQ